MGTSRTRQGTFKDEKGKAWGHLGLSKGASGLESEKHGNIQDPSGNGEQKAWEHPGLGNGPPERGRERHGDVQGHGEQRGDIQGHGERDRDTQGHGEQDRARTLRYPGA